MITETRRQLASLKGPNPKIKAVRYKGIRISLYSIGWLSYLTSVAPVTLRLWEREKTLPDPIFPRTANARWFSAPEVSEYNILIGNFLKTGRDKKLLIRELWNMRNIIARNYEKYSQEDELNFPKNYKLLAKAEKLLRALREAKRVAVRKVVQNELDNG